MTYLTSLEGQVQMQVQYKKEGQLSFKLLNLILCVVIKLTTYQRTPHLVEEMKLYVVCLSVCPSIRLSICPSVCLDILSFLGTEVFTCVDDS